MKTDAEILAEMVTAYRQAHPRSRVTAIIRWEQNGGTVKQRACILCGAAGPTWNGKWKKTKTAVDWEAAHVAAHVAQRRGGEP